MPPSPVGRTISRRPDAQPAGQSLGALLGTLAARGNAPAIVALREQGARRVAGRELAQAASALARGLARAGVGRGDRVAVFAANSPEWIIACLGTLAAGAVVMPLDAQFPDEDLRHALVDGAPRLAFTDAKRARRLRQAGAGARRYLLDAEQGAAQSWHGLLEKHGELPLLEPRDYAALFYTSGTTGPPKGVPLTHANLTSQLVALSAAGIVDESDRALVPLPLHHVYPFVLGMLVPLELGVPIVLPHALTGPEIARAMREGEASVVVGVPKLYAALAQGVESRAGRAFRPLRALSLGLQRLGLEPGRRLFAPLHRRTGGRVRLLASGGAPLAPDLERTLRALGWQVAVGYGLTETSPLVTLRAPGEGTPGSVGRAVPGVELRTEEGELLVRGPNVFGGYRGLEEKTRKAFTADGWFRTGDLGEIDADGRVRLVGRRSEMIVTAGGKNVQPEDVEKAYAQHAALREVGVFQKGEKLVALVVPEPKALREAEDAAKLVERALGERGKALPSYQRVTEFAVTREALERTRLGKLRRHKLEARFAQARKGDEGREGPLPVEKMSGEDRTLLENPAARQVWDYLAGRFAHAPLTPDSALELDLGIDSLEWVNLTLEISQRTGVELDEEAIAGLDTVRDLLAALARAERGAGPDIAAHPEKALDEHQRRWLRELPRPLRLLAARLRGFNRFTMRRLYRLERHGLEHLEDAGGALVFAPNHVSLLDPPALAAALDDERLQRLYWGGWVGIAFGNAFMRAASRLLQALPVDPRQGPISSLAFAATVLKRGKSLVWFPEGERAPDGRRQALKPGITLLLEAQDVPVVPVHIAGTYEALPVGRWLPRLGGRVAVRFGRPIKRATLLREGEGGDAREKVLHALGRRIDELAAQEKRD